MYLSPKCQSFLRQGQTISDFSKCSEMVCLWRKTDWHMRLRYRALNTSPIRAGNGKISNGRNILHWQNVRHPKQYFYAEGGGGYIRREFRHLCCRWGSCVFLQCAAACLSFHCPYTARPSSPNHQLSIEIEADSKITRNFVLSFQLSTNNTDFRMYRM